MSSPPERGTEPLVSGGRFILQARECLEQGCRLQAGKMAWEAIACYLKEIGDQRGWHCDSNRQVQQIGIQLWPEFLDFELGFAIIDIYYKGYDNLYENYMSKESLRELIDLAEEVLPALEALQHTAPSPFTITSNTQLRRLRSLTGNNDLQIGDSSPVGFSLKHSPNGDADAAET